MSASQACSPGFSPDVFVREGRPDLPLQFAEGKLGILQPTYPRADLFVAYRYLNGGALDAEERKAWQPAYSPSEPEWDALAASTAFSETGSSTQWVLARKQFPDAPAEPIAQERTLLVSAAPGVEYREQFLNCTDDAFVQASATLKNRAGRWGTGPYLRDWLHAQDAVFKNCSGGSTMPPAAPEGSPALLVQDRAYQTSAALFYSQIYPAAAAAFAIVEKDRSSPWQPIAGYLVARALIREAFFARPGAAAQADYDPEMMHTAELQLRAYLQAAPPPPLRRAAEAQLALVRVRLEPEQRARELGALLSGPAQDPNYAQDLRDLLWLADAHTPDGLRAGPELWDQVPDEQHPGQMRAATEAEAARKALAKQHAAYAASLRSAAPILDWAITFQALDPAAASHALAEWRRTRSQAWLLAALALAPDASPPPTDLLAAAALVPADAPGWQTITFHRARLLLAVGHAAEARSVISATLARLQHAPPPEQEPSSVNAFRGLAMLAAPTLDDFLSFAPRRLLLATSEEAFSSRECLEVMKNPRRHYGCAQDIDPDQLDADASRVFNEQAPLAVWMEAAQAPALPPQLREAIAMSGWTRAVLLGDHTAFTAFTPLLPQAFKNTDVNDPLARWMVLARNPGLNPYLDAGTQRGYSYDFVESYRDNWCYRATTETSPVKASFLSAGEKLEGEKQAQALSAADEATLARHIVDAVEANAEDPRSPEALFLVLRMTRYGCIEPAAPAPTTGGQVQAVPYQWSEESRQLLGFKQRASRLLRQRYARSEWTKKAAPFAG